jgi:hypothetical protein
LTGTVSVNKKLLTGTVPVNNLFLKGTPKKSSPSGELGSPNSPKSYFKTPCNISEAKDNPFLVKSMWNRKKNNPKFKLTLMGVPGLGTLGPHGHERNLHVRRKISASVNGGLSEGLACADPGARTPIGTSRNFFFYLSVPHTFLPEGVIVGFRNFAWGLN